MHGQQNIKKSNSNKVVLCLTDTSLCVNINDLSYKKQPSAQYVSVSLYLK